MIKRLLVFRKSVCVRVCLSVYVSGLPLKLDDSKMLYICNLSAFTAHRNSSLTIYTKPFITFQQTKAYTEG